MTDDRHDEGEAPGEGKPAFTPQSSRFLWFVGALGGAALILGGVQFSRALREPFLPQQPTLATAGPESQALIALKSKDTDGDGLSDYDELYATNTSPYIADSDSDGTDDSTEVDRGTDPNCPEGTNCGVVTNTNATNATSTNTAVAAGNPTAQQIRDALVASGVSQTQVDALDDATLLQSYQEALAEDTSTNTNASTTSAQQLEDLTASEIRSLLQANGVSADVLKSYDDETLRAVYLEAVRESLSSSTNTNGS